MERRVAGAEAVHTRLMPHERRSRAAAANTASYAATPHSATEASPSAAAPYSAVAASPFAAASHSATAAASHVSYEDRLDAAFFRGHLNDGTFDAAAARAAEPRAAAGTGSPQQPPPPATSLPASPQQILASPPPPPPFNCVSPRLRYFFYGPFCAKALTWKRSVRTHAFFSRLLTPSHAFSRRAHALSPLLPSHIPPFTPKSLTMNTRFHTCRCSSAHRRCMHCS